MKKLKILLLSLLCIPSILNALEIDGLYSKNILVYDLDENQVLYEKESDVKTSIASLTKIMTTILSIENIANLNEEVTITYNMLKDVPWDASVAGLEVGDILTYKDLLYASMLPSGADATDSLAVSLFSDVDTFVEKMNEKAKELGLENTHFVNTTGLDIDGHYSSAIDLLKLLKYALNNETFKEIFTTKNYTTTNGIKLNSTIDSYNRRLNYDLSYVLGSKTGYTDDAGLCLITLSNINDENIITISINAPVDEQHNKNVVDLANIHDALDENYKKVKLYSEGNVLKTLNTKYAKELNIDILASKDIYKYVEGEFDESLVRIEYEGIDNIAYNTMVDESLGNIKVYYDKYLVYEEEVKLNHELSFSLWEFIKKEKVYILLSVFALLIIVTSIISRNKKHKRRIKK